MNPSGVGAPGFESCRMWAPETELQPLQEHQALFATEPLLQSLRSTYHFLMWLLGHIRMQVIMLCSNHFTHGVISPVPGIILPDTFSLVFRVRALEIHFPPFLPLFLFMRCAHMSYCIMLPWRTPTDVIAESTEINSVPSQ